MWYIVKKIVPNVSTDRYDCKWDSMEFEKQQIKIQFLVALNANKIVISVQMKDFMLHHPSVSFTTYTGRDAVLRHTLVEKIQVL